MAEEKLFENKIKKYLTDLGAYHIKNFGCAFTRAGVPDLSVCLNGQFIAIEVKASKGKPSPLQIHNLIKIHEAGGYALLVYPKDYELLTALLRAINSDSQNKRALYLDYFVPRFL